MVRSFLITIMVMIVAISCSRPEKRSARYDTTACPICSNITDGTCSYCMGTKQCMFCKGNKDRQTVSPNIMEEKIKPFSYKTPCPYCRNSGVCTYCTGSGKCWACGGSKKVSANWDCLNERTPQTAAVTK